MNITNERQYYESGTIAGSSPEIRYGVDYPDGDAQPWTAMPLGSTYRRVTAGFVASWMKVQNNQDDQDWVLLQGVICETIAVADLTDSSTTGTVTMAGDIPVGAEVTRTDLRKITGFAGDTSATIQVGDGSDADRYTTGTPNVFATAEMIDAGAVSGTAVHIAAVSPVITITSAADFTSVVTDGNGKLTVAIWFNGVV